MIVCELLPRARTVPGLQLQALCWGDPDARSLLHVEAAADSVASGIQECLHG